MAVQLLRDYVVASGLAAYLRGEIARRGWDDSELARRAGIDKSALSYILNTPDAVPRLKTLGALAEALHVPLARLITVSGFDLGNESESANNERIAILLNSVPELQSVVDRVAQLSPDDVRALLAYIDGMRQRDRLS